MPRVTIAFRRVPFVDLTQVPFTVGTQRCSWTALAPFSAIRQTPEVRKHTIDRVVVS